MASPKIYKGRDIVSEDGARHDGYAAVTNGFSKTQEAMLDGVIADMERAGADFCLVAADGGICVFKKRRDAGGA